MTREKAIALVREVSNYMATRPEIDEAIDMAIEALEQIESGRYVKGECSICSKEYGTLGCCTTVSNHWIYSCKEGMAQYAEALDQEPCEDAVSRKELLDKAYAYGNGLEPEGYCVEVEDIQALPPVTPTRKKGKWIDNHNGTFSCNKCQSWLPKEQRHYARYCLHCGIKMEIEEAPTIDIDRPQGKWIDRGSCQVDEDAYDVATCSECDEEITIDPLYDNYCPNCGARMESDTE